MISVMNMVVIGYHLFYSYRFLFIFVKTKQEEQVNQIKMWGTLVIPHGKRGKKVQHSNFQKENQSGETK